jgi:hypothetical protein
VIELPEPDQGSVRHPRRHRAVIAGAAAALVVVLTILVAARSDKPRVRVAGESSTTAPAESTTFEPSTRLPGGTALDFGGGGSGPAGPGSPWTVGPTTGLRNFDTVLFSGTGLPAGAYQVGQCPASDARAGNFNGCHYHEVTVGGDGRFASSLTVEWRLGGRDCGAAPNVCLVGVRNANPRSSWKPVAWDITFDAAHRPRMEVSPNAGLVEGQTVEVRGYDIGPAAISFYEMCGSGPLCGAAVETSTAADGSFRAALTVHYSFRYIAHAMDIGPGVCDGETCAISMTATYSRPAEVGSRWDAEVSLGFAAVPPTTAPAPMLPPTTVAEPGAAPSTTSTTAAQ